MPAVEVNIYVRVRRTWPTRLGLAAALRLPSRWRPSFGLWLVNAGLRLAQAEFSMDGRRWRPVREAWPPFRLAKGAA